jgi:arylsulfatase A
MRNLTPHSRLISCLIIFAVLVTSACKKTDLIPEKSIKSETGIEELIKSKPNIILILGDDIGYEIPGFTGGQSWSTPNINQMASQGLKFLNCYGSPMCAPSRFMLLTGKYNYRNYYPDSWGDLGLDQRTIANMLRSHGYTTCVSGKWQLNHGDTGLATFGFNKYCITNPFKVATEDNSPGFRLYKNPTIYQNGAYLPAAQTRGKYSEDLFLKYMFDFMDSSSNAKKPFFVYWAPNLCHRPFSPTPDDPEFASWDPNRKPGDADTVFFKSMIKYYDKNVGKLMARLKASNLENNTLVLFLVGDNGTDDIIRSRFNNGNVYGGKGHTYSTGTHVAFVAYWPGHIAPGKNSNLVDFVDFMPTIADAAGIGKPTTYGPIDGISFYKQLLGDTSAARQYSYNWYDVNRDGPDETPPIVWAMDKTYKLYSNKTSLIHYTNDGLEKSPIPNSMQTGAERKERSTLQNVINSYHN